MQVEAGGCKPCAERDGDEAGRVQDVRLRGDKYATQTFKEATNRAGEGAYDGGEAATNGKRKMRKRGCSGT